MTTHKLPFLAFVLAAACGTAIPDAGSFTDGQKQLVVRHSDAAYKPCPPTLRVKCEMAVLEGNPREAGLFTLRIRTAEPFTLNAHNHPQSERVTVLGGRISVGFGDAVDKGASTTFGAGDYYVNRTGENHFVWADEPVEIQITGMGPWEMHFHE